ncbi:hemerythrin domain-containing protein [Nonomuraea phyllanthi]|uniref:Hemerythrin domain-containing protein n=1 Tax=Nonomuraea phyllanthi TaxID=2219224 RepID=A0A5C4WSY1_9ACTN|nr:hemerythrin domain-containing protein [Nonomuraea phyllanthi]KAB8196747.1 hemerythrin domain-containing protein [Nonomuraea phyllanthi]QFY13516.1 hemerythrin domain-containing protein [Nonomuraea phyllanthi]
MDTQQDVIAVLVTDHREVEQMFSELEHMKGGISDQAKTLAEKVVIELVRHSIAEEEHLYPAVRQHVPGGGKLADQEIAEHADAEETMKRLEGLEPGDNDFWPTMGLLMSQIRDHIREEENDLFPRLRESCPPEQLVDLGGKVERAKKTAPTRPHPSAPDTPPGNKLLAPGAGLVDRIRDAITGRGR